MMNKKTKDVWITAVGGGLAAVGLVFILISVFGKESADWTLRAGLACVALGSLLNALRLYRNKKEQ